MRSLLGVVLALCTGCYSAVLVPFQTFSSKQYEVADRPAVWSRALEAFQDRGQLIAMSDSLGGLVRTENQYLWTVCSNTPEKKCLTREHDQLTIGTDGSAFLRRYYVARGNVRGDESPYSEEDWALMKQDCADFLAYIVGTATEAPTPPERPPPESLNRGSDFLIRWGSVTGQIRVASGR